MQRSFRDISQASVVVALSTAALFAYDAAPVIARLSSPALFGVLSLGLTLGALLGVLLATYLYATLLSRPLLRFLCDAIMFGSVTAWLFDELGILAKWDGPTKHLAQLAAGSAIAFGLMLVLTAIVTRAILRDPGGTRALRLFAFVGYVIAAFAVGYVEEQYASAAYPSLDGPLRVTQLALVGLAAMVLFAHEKRLELSAGSWVLGLSVAAISANFLLSAPADLHALLAHPPARPLIVMLRRLTDFDQDGYSAWLGGQDCAAFNPKIRPLARDVPGDGVDQDCRHGDAPARKAASNDRNAWKLAPNSPAPSDATSVVLVTIDTLRADRMSVYGATRDTTPLLQEWAKDAVRFDRAYTAGGWTSLALPSMFRGRYPRRLSWTRVFETNRMRLIRAQTLLPTLSRERIRKSFALPLEDQHPTINQLLEKRGYMTAAVIDDGYTSYFRRELGAFPGFEFYQNVGAPWGDRHTTNAAMSWLSRAPKDRPFFLWTHYFGPHSPSEAHPGLRDYGKSHVDKYDAEIAFLDLHLARLLDRIDALGKERRIAVIVTSDHGEEFTRRERHHGLSLADGALHIPMLVRAPEVAPRVSKEVVSLVDVMPTVLGLARVESPNRLDGKDLLALPAQDSPQRSVSFETWRLDRNGEIMLNLVGATDGKHKVTLDTFLLDETAYEMSEGGEREVRASARHRELMDELYGQLGEDGALRLSN